MNFSISKRTLLNALTIVSKAISNAAPIPSLSGVKIDVLSESIVLTGSDSNLSIKCTILEKDENAKLLIFEEGGVVIDARYINEIARKIDGDIITIETIDGTFMRIKGNNAEFKINGMRASDYPVIDFTYNQETFEIDTKVFDDIVKQTGFACSETTVVPALTGVNLIAKDTLLTCNATNSYRLASKKINLPTAQNFNIVIPAKTLSDVVNILNDQKTFLISIVDKYIFFISENTTIRARLIEDRYPDVSRLIPATFTQELVIKSKDLLDAVDRASFIKNEGKSSVKMEIFSDRIDISSFNQEIGSSHESLSLISFKGFPFKISCNGKYLTDAIKALKSDEITLVFSGESKPFIIKTTEDENIVQLISPIRSYN